MCVSNERARVSVEYLCQCASLMCSYVSAMGICMSVFLCGPMSAVGCECVRMLSVSALCVHMGVYMCQHCMHVCVNVSAYA